VISEKDLKCIIYISIYKIFTVYMMKLQSLIMTISIVSVMKRIKSEL